MEPTGFKETLAEYVAGQSSKSAAARALGVTRMDLHRYLGGKTTPRRERLKGMMGLMTLSASPSVRALEATQNISLDAKSVTQLRNGLLHLLALLDLDLASRGSNERKGG